MIIKWAISNSLTPTRLIQYVLCPYNGEIFQPKQVGHFQIATRNDF